MSDAQPIASIEPALPTIAASGVTMATSDTQPAVPTVAPASSETTTEKSEAPPKIPLVSDNVPASWLWLTKYDQAFVAVCVALFLALTGYHWAKLGGWGMVPIDLDRLPARQYDFRIDINSASWVEWTQIEGIGEATADKIIADREANGPFRSINDLLRVKEIGRAHV